MLRYQIKSKREIEGLWVCSAQGWRLDPLLLFCQLLTAGTALGFAVESLRLRQEVRDIQVCLGVPHRM